MSIDFSKIEWVTETGPSKDGLTQVAETAEANGIQRTSPSITAPGITIPVEGDNLLTVPINSCIKDFQYDGGSPFDTEFSYAVEIEFASSEALQNFINMPNAKEIYRELEQLIEVKGREVLELEINRDTDGNLDPSDSPYSPEELGPQLFTNGTVEDFNYLLSEDIVLQMNETYGLDIQKAWVNEESDQHEGCSPNPFLPQNHGQAPVTEQPQEIASSNGPSNFSFQ